MKAFLIARVSTDEQADALPGQVYRLEDYANAKGYEYELFQLQESAYRGNRTSFKKIIERVQEHHEPYVIVFDKIDRYTRNSNSDEVMVLNGLCRLGMIELHFPSDHLFINKDSSAQEKFMLNVGISNAQYYSDSSADNVKRRIEQKLRDGECIGHVPIGYKNFRQENGKADVKVDTFYAEAVKEAFKLYASGNVALRDISRLWRDKYAIDRHINVIAKILHNPFYCGLIKHNDKLYPHKYEKLISTELFEQVQQQFEQFATRKKRWAGIEFQYRGLITCSDCGSRITFERHKEKYIYAKCASGRGVHIVTYVAESKLTSQFENLIRGITIPDIAYKQVKEAVEGEYSDRKQYSAERLRTIDTELAKYASRKEKMYVDHLDEVIPDELYRKKLDEFTKAERILREQRENIELITEDKLANILYLLKLANNAPNLFKKANQMQKRKIISLVLSNLELSNKKLRWQYKKPFDTMAFCVENGTWCG